MTKNPSSPVPLGEDQDAGTMPEPEMHARASGAELQKIEGRVLLRIAGVARAGALGRGSPSCAR